MQCFSRLWFIRVLHAQNGQTPLHYAVAAGNTCMARMLISAGADLDIKDNKGLTALHQAAKKNNKDAVEKIVDCGRAVAVFSLANNGWSALHFAASRDSVECFRYLHAIAVSTGFADMGTVRHVAHKHGAKNVVRFIEANNGTRAATDGVFRQHCSVAPGTAVASKHGSPSSASESMSSMSSLDSLVSISVQEVCDLDEFERLEKQCAASDRPHCPVEVKPKGNAGQPQFTSTPQKSPPRLQLSRAGSALVSPQQLQQQHTPRMLFTSPEPVQQPRQTPRPSTPRFRAPRSKPSKPKIQCTVSSWA